MISGRSRLERLAPADEAQVLDQAVNGLLRQDPSRSAALPLMGWQRPALWGVLLTSVVCGVLWPTTTIVAAVALCTAAYVFTLVDRVMIFRQGLAASAIVVPDEEARAIPDAELPPYTILVPAYHEPEVVGDLIAAMGAMEYPRSKLQVLLLLEADDQATIDAARQYADADFIEMVLIPPAQPRTKPKACNYGLHFATGDIVTIYDAEDRPDPLQLRRVVSVFRSSPDDIVCVQARLAFYNGHQNLLTGWFTAEYGLWFGFLLPGMMRTGTPIPLGGTSNHLLTRVLDTIGAWDPHNVTEDADLGLRIAANGYETAVVESTTLEEANSDSINWIRQRSRWYKGYLQTWLVEMRRPRALMRMLGVRAFIRFNLILGGTPVIAVLNLFFWLITLLWFLGHPAAVSAMFPAYVYFPALLCLVLGNLATIYMNLVALREDDRSDLLVPALTVPAFWVMMSVAAAKGLYQLIRSPSYWEKTVHGLVVDAPAETPAGR
ncbi:glycosyltransferase [Mycolicibacterium baixiangningiae]|uniref:glycosyltransferase n=1 Tax=Mycolicibacterium baixiangningiae TaxID=2761578 RepID=UPI0018677810|nr:glycosyltransferase [Mycolicibacterium baixiangningiae]